MSKWISVKDHKPSNNRDVLAVDDRGKRVVSFYFSEFDGSYLWSYDDGVITHWMELPEPPDAD